LKLVKVQITKSKFAQMANRKWKFATGSRI